MNNSNENQSLKSSWHEVAFRQTNSNRGHTLIVEVDRPIYEQADQNLRRALIEAAFLNQDFYLVPPNNQAERVYFTPRKDGRHKPYKLISSGLSTPVDLKLEIRKLGSRLHANISAHHLDGTNLVQVAHYRQVVPLRDYN